MGCELLGFLRLQCLGRYSCCCGAGARLTIIAVELMLQAATQAVGEAHTLGVEQAVAGGTGQGGES